MFQRIQTVYLLLAILLSGLVAFSFPIWTGQDMELVYLNSMLLSGDYLTNVIPILFIISGLFGILALFSFKKRTRQISYNRLNIVINFLLLGIIVYRLLNLPGETVVSEKGIGIFIPVLVVVCLALANKAIIKDEKLVKSVDRLR